MLSAGDFTPWAEALMLQWHTDDPVSTKEIDRNNAVYALQDNRNPYIDHPEWVAAIWGPNAGVDEAAAAGPRMWLAEGALHMQGFAGQRTIEISDALGRTVFATSTSDDIVTLPTLPEGLLIVRARSAKEQVGVPVVM